MSGKINRRVVITGIGPIASVGIGRKMFWEGIIKKKTGVELVESFLIKEMWEKFYIHKVKNFDIKNFEIDQNSLEYIKNWKEGEDNIDLLFLLGAIKLALDDAGIEYKSKKNNCGLIVTHENLGLEQLLWKTFRGSYQLLRKNSTFSEKEFCASLYKEIIKSGYETQSFMSLFHLARTFNIHNYSLFLNNACASGLYAIEAAKDMLVLGKAHQVIVAAGDCPDIFKYLWFKMIDMYAPDGRIKPFSSDARGFIGGEGATALILEDYEYAKQRNAHIYAEYLGGGFQLEGWGVTTPMIGGNFYKQAICDALVNSKVDKKEVDLICAHAVGTLASDYYEAKAIMDVFSGSTVPVTAFKPYVGHNLGGSTLIELAILLLSMKNNIMLPVLNTKQLAPKINLNLVRDEKTSKLQTVLKICSAFAGYNAATVFRKLD